MTIMLQDVAMILGLCINGLPMTGDISSVGWRDRVGDWLGVRPDDPTQDARDNWHLYFVSFSKNCISVS